MSLQNSVKDYASDKEPFGTVESFSMDFNCLDNNPNSSGQDANTSNRSDGAAAMSEHASPRPLDKENIG